jgi:hypothetical protein
MNQKSKKKILPELIFFQSIFVRSSLVASPFSCASFVRKVKYRNGNVVNKNSTGTQNDSMLERSAGTTEITTKFQVHVNIFFSFLETMVFDHPVGVCSDSSQNNNRRLNQEQHSDTQHNKSNIE